MVYVFAESYNTLIDNFINLKESGYVTGKSLHIERDKNLWYFRFRLTRKGNKHICNFIFTKCSFFFKKPSKTRLMLTFDSYQRESEIELFLRGLRRSKN